MKRFVLPLLVAAALPSPAAAFTNPQIPGLQVALRARGYYTGPIDGIVGATYPLRRWRSAIDHALGAGRLGTLKVAFDVRAD